MSKYFVLITVILLCFFYIFQPINSLNATNVSGDIDTDTQWILSDSPYILIDSVQVAEGATLIIDPGVAVEPDYSAMNPFETITVYGKLIAVGTDTNKINLKLLAIRSASSTLAITIQYCLLQGTYISLWQSQNCDFSILDSIFQHTDRSGPGGVEIFQASGTYNIERNIIPGGLQILGSTGIMEVKNNVLVPTLDRYSGDAQVWCNGNSFLNIQYNSFLDNDRIVLQADSGHLSATDNFWNTIDTTVIDSMIYDKNDDASNTFEVIYEPILAEKHPNTPNYSLDSNDDGGGGGGGGCFIEILHY